MQAEHEAQENARLTPLGELRGWDRNPRTITPERLEQLKRALRAAPLMLWARPLAALPDGRVILGNQRLRAITEMHAAGEAGWETVPVVVVDLDEETAAEWAIRDNNEYGVWQEEELGALLRELEQGGRDLDLTGFGPGELERLLGDLEQTKDLRAGRPSLADRFVVPPFSVLDQRAGYWQERRRGWLSIGIRSELGRDAPIGGSPLPLDRPSGRRAEGSRAMATGVLMASVSGRDPAFYDQKRALEARLGREVPTDEFIRTYYVPTTGVGGLTTTGTSVFDPVLCELVYRWFSGPHARVLDPFAGGSVRGIVASALGRMYVGIDLSDRQVFENREQAAEILSEDDPAPAWVIGSLDTDVLLEDHGPFDLIFTCPPYYDLERYSDDPRDLSTMTAAAFDATYARILGEAVSALAADSFAVIVVSDVRDKAGMYRPLADRTTEIMASLGLGLYNRAVLVNTIGSLAVRVGRQFSAARKLGRTHQDVLVYVKGDPRRAAERCGQVDITLEAVLPVEIVDAITAEPDDETVPVKVSAASARQAFHGCEPGYIEHVCKGRCCESASAPGGTLISIHPSEEPALVKLGARIEQGRLVTPERRCMFKTAVNLCALHGEEAKPFGCIASPFTLHSSADTLIVRNRYRLLPCYKAEGGEWSERGVGAAPLPAYRAFAASLRLLFGDDEADRITAHFDAGGGDLTARMPIATRAMLRDLDAVKH